MAKKIPAGYKLVTVLVEVPVVVPVDVSDPDRLMQAVVGAFWAGTATYAGVKQAPADLLLHAVQTWFNGYREGHAPTTLAHALRIMDNMASAVCLPEEANDLRHQIRDLRSQQWQVLNAGIRRAVAGTNLAQPLAQALAEDTLTPAQAVAHLRTLPPTPATDAICADLIRYRDAWFAGQEA